MSFRDPPPRSRWSRSQKFVLSSRGQEVEAEYLEKIVASRAHAGRDSFDAARAAWAALHRLEPDDGLYLTEMRPGPVNLTQIITGIEACGKTRNEAVEAMKRLVDLGLVSVHEERA